MFETQYLDLMRNIIENGVKKPNRTGVPTYSIFGNTMRFQLSEGTKLILPLITTKRVAHRLIVEELLWFMSGSTDAKVLDAKNVKIWNANSSRDFLDKVGLTEYREGDIGAGYGFQLRHFGAEYRGCDEDYTGEGVDQLENVRRSIIDDPYSRRHIISLWNPVDLPKMALQPCHMLCQFSVSPGSEGLKLDCSVYQRSADVPLGVPFNIASYATLTHIMAKLTNTIPSELIYTTGDTHIYENQIEQAKVQISRQPYDFPNIEIDKLDKFEDYNWDNFRLVNYKSHPKLDYEFSA